MKHQHTDQYNDTGSSERDSGYTLMEMIIVVVILGILTSVVALVVTGISTEASATGCQADTHILYTAAEAYFAQRAADEIPATGPDADRFERTLAEGGFLRFPSTYHDLDADGLVTAQENSPC